jgi:hypothetical protein
MVSNAVSAVQTSVASAIDLGQGMVNAGSPAFAGCHCWLVQQ